MKRSRTRQAPAFTLFSLALLALLLSLATSATANPSIQSKRAQAQAVLAQIAQSNTKLEKTIESYNLATDQLSQIDGDLRANTRHLAVAQKSLGVAQVNIADRLRALYVNGDGGGAVEVILGAQNLDDLLGRIDMVQRVSTQDAKVLTAVKRFRKQVNESRTRLTSARIAQARLVEQRSSQKQAIEGQLAGQQGMLAGIQDEIATLKAEEARRQERLASEAQARFAAQQRAASAARVQSVEVTADPSAAGDSSIPVADPSIPAAPPSQYGGVVGIAMQELGKPYVWAAAGPGSFDCSGLVQYVYAQVGVSLPHNAAAMYSYGTPVSYDDLQPGDLVFFSGLGHMGLYIGGGQFIHAPQTGDVVKISNMSDHGSYVGARRL